MELLHALFVAPFLDIWGSPVFFAEVVIVGLLTGVMVVGGLDLWLSCARDQKKGQRLQAQNLSHLLSKTD